jgi:hypothetical protein
MPLFTRTDRGVGRDFASFYKDVENTLKKNKYLDAGGKAKCRKILKSGDHFWGPVEAKDHRNYEKLIASYLKDSKKSFAKILDDANKAEIKDKAS